MTIYKFILHIKPDECYHLAASSFVSYQFNDELSTISANFSSSHFLLSSIKEIVPACRFFLAGSSEMFGNAEKYPQNEKTAFNPRSMYGISKTSASYIVKNYRDSQNIYACTGITYNNESPRRNISFVTRKITSSVAKIYLGLSNYIELGNVDAERDWGYAPEYVVAMHKMLNSTKGSIDYVIATGKKVSVKTFLNLAFSIVDLNYEKYLKINNTFFRPSEHIPLVGESLK